MPSYISQAAERLAREVHGLEGLRNSANEEDGIGFAAHRSPIALVPGFGAPSLDESRHCQEEASGGRCPNCESLFSDGCERSSSCLSQSKASSALKRDG